MLTPGSIFTVTSDNILSFALVSTFTSSVCLDLGLLPLELVYSCDFRLLFKSSLDLMTLRKERLLLCSSKAGVTGGISSGFVLDRGVAPVSFPRFVNSFSSDPFSDVDRTVSVSLFLSSSIFSTNVR